MSPYLPDVTLEHKPGSVNKAVDALSRAPVISINEEVTLATEVLSVEEEPLIARISFL